MCVCSLSDRIRIKRGGLSGLATDKTFSVARFDPFLSLCHSLVNLLFEESLLRCYAKRSLKTM